MRTEGRMLQITVANDSALGLLRDSSRGESKCRQYGDEQARFYAAKLTATRL